MKLSEFLLAPVSSFGSPFLTELYRTKEQFLLFCRAFAIIFRFHYQTGCAMPHSCVVTTQEGKFFNLDFAYQLGKIAADAVACCRGCNISLSLLLIQSKQFNCSFDSGTDHRCFYDVCLAHSWTLLLPRNPWIWNTVHLEYLQTTATGSNSVPVKMLFHQRLNGMK